MRMRFALLLNALVAGVLSAQQPAAAPTSAVPLDRIVAIVGDKPITLFELQERVNQRRQEGATLPTDSTAMLELLRTTVGEMVDEEVLIQKAAELKVELADADVNNTVDRQFREIRGRFNSEAEFRAELQRAGLGSPEEYRRFLTDVVRRGEIQKLALDRLKKDGRFVPVNVSEAEVAEEFARNKAQRPKREASVAFRQIIIAPQPSAAAKERARAKAESLLVEIKSGAEFERIAKRESMDPSRDNGGDLGWARRGVMVPEFERWIFSLSPGQLSPVVETPFGFHVIRVDRVQPAEVKSRHVLIRPQIDTADVARARKSADSVAAALRAGASLDTVTRRYHDFANNEETTVPEIPLSRTPATYQEVLKGAGSGSVVGPFAIPGSVENVPKLVVVQVTESKPEGEYALEDVRDLLRSRLVEIASIRRLLDALRKETYVSIRLDRSAVAGLGATQ